MTPTTGFVIVTTLFVATYVVLAVFAVYRMIVDLGKTLGPVIMFPAVALLGLAACFLGYAHDEFQKPPTAPEQAVASTAAEKGAGDE